MNSRLVITGMGAITPIGQNVEDYWRNLIAGKCGVGPITRFDASRLPVRIAAEIHNFDRELLPKAVARSASSFIQYAYAAAVEALTQSGIHVEKEGDRIGICMGTAMAGAHDIAQSGADYQNSSTGRISPHLVPKAIGNMAAAHLAIHFGIRGPGLTLNTACSAGSDAIMSAAMLMLSGEADSMIVMGGESILSPSVVSSLAQARALSRRNDDPLTASRPFDAGRDGFVIGEGGGAIVLETEEHALKRGAEILAELKSWANCLDSYHITAPDPSGNGAAACMRAAIDKAGITPDNIDYINAHGTSTQLGDKAETLAVKKVFNGFSTPPISSTKGSTGHLMGAGGLTELIACVRSMEEGIIPPTLNLESPDPECDLDYVPNKARKASVNIAMSNSLGFGGQNSSLIVARYCK